MRGLLGLTRSIAHRVVKRIRRPARLRAERRQFDQYLAGHGTRSLHIGCGSHALPDWLNTDLEPKAPGVVRLDATRPFPLPDASIDFIYSEHMIEHLPYASGLALLAECFRVLRPGGILRLVTPDLQFLVDLLQPSLSPLQRAYVEWSTRSFLPHAPRPDAAFVVNNFVRDWGHQFIYDRPTLRDALERAGFRGVIEPRLGESDHPALRRLENEGRMPAGFLALESMLFEATKTGAAAA